MKRKNVLTNLYVYIIIVPYNKNQWIMFLKIWKIIPSDLTAPAMCQSAVLLPALHCSFTSAFRLEMMSRSIYSLVTDGDAVPETWPLRLILDAKA